MANIRKITGKTGKVSFRIDYRDPDGKRVMKRFKLQKDAKAYLAKVQTAINENEYEQIFGTKKKSTITFNELANHYQQNYQHQKSYRTFKSHVVKVLRDNFGSKWLTEISYLDLKTFRDTWRTTPIKSGTKKRTDATVNRYLVVFGHMLNKAVEWGMLDVSPFKKGSRLILKENNLRDRFLSQEEIEALLGACSPHLLPVVEMALHTGLRKGELLSMQWKQVKGGLIYLRETKSKKPRKIPIDERAAQIFKQIRARNKWGSPYVFLDPDGKPLADVKKAFLGACRRAGIDNFRFHDLRHTFASHLIMRGASIKAVQQLLGHAESRTSDRYSHLAPDHLRDAINLLADIPHGNLLENILPLPNANSGAGMEI